MFAINCVLLLLLLLLIVTKDDGLFLFIQILVMTSKAQKGTDSFYHSHICQRTNWEQRGTPSKEDPWEPFPRLPVRPWDDIQEYKRGPFSWEPNKNLRTRRPWDDIQEYKRGPFSWEPNTNLRTQRGRLSQGALTLPLPQTNITSYMYSNITNLLRYTYPVQYNPKITIQHKIINIYYLQGLSNISQIKTL